MSEMSMPKMRVRVPPQMSLMDFRRYLLREEIPTGKVSRFADLVAADMLDGWWITPEEIEAEIATFRGSVEAAKVFQFYSQTTKTALPRYLKNSYAEIDKYVTESERVGVPVEERVESILEREFEMLGEIRKETVSMLAARKASQNMDEVETCRPRR